MTPDATKEARMPDKPDKPEMSPKKALAVFALAAVLFGGGWWLLSRHSPPDPVTVESVGPAGGTSPTHLFVEFLVKNPRSAPAHPTCTAVVNGPLGISGVNVESYTHVPPHSSAAAHMVVKVSDHGAGVVSRSDVKVTCKG
jgi:hypothetical protein